MKRFLHVAPTLILALLIATGCGKSTSCPTGQYAVGSSCVSSTAGYNGGTMVNGYGNACPSGQFNTQYGCLAQGSCPNGQAYYFQGQSCVAVLQNSYTNGYQNGAYGNGGCMNGQFMTYLGCLPQGPCQYGMAYAQVYNQCIPTQMNGSSGYGNGCPMGTGFSYTTYSCLPQGNCPMGMYRYGPYCVN